MMINLEARLTEETIFILGPYCRTPE